MTDLITCLVVGGILLASAASAHAGDVYVPPDAGTLNVKMFGAKGDGVADDTAPIQKALSEALGSHRIVYFPKGTYLLSNRLEWRRGTEGGTKGWGPFLQVQGENQQQTILRLQDRCPGFVNPAQPRAVIQTGSSGSHGNKQYNEGEGNEAFENHIRDITVDVGQGNPGAIGIDYQVSNFGALRNVTVRTNDVGAIGVNLGRRDNGPGLLTHVQIMGFDTGIQLSQEICQMTFEHISLKGQKKLGISCRDAVLAMRDIQSDNHVPVLNVAGRALVTVFDSRFVGGKAPQSAIANEDDDACVLLRHVETSGYENAVVNRGERVAGGQIDCWNSDAPLGGASPTLLPRRDTPTFADPAASEWASVGPPSGKDDTAAVQRAMDSGKRVVYFPAGRFFVRKTIAVPPSVKLIRGFGAEPDAGAHRDEPMFRFVGGTASDMTMVDRISVSGHDGFVFQNASPRALVLRDIGTFGGKPFLSAPQCGPLYIEDVAGAGYHFDHPMDVWARQWDIEGGGGVKTVVKGARLWALGYKHEGGDTVMAASDGAQIELYGGLAYTFGMPDTTIAFTIVNSDAVISLAGTTYVPNGYFKRLVDSTQDGKTTSLMTKDAFTRGGGAMLPLYATRRAPK